MRPMAEVAMFLMVFLYNMGCLPFFCSAEFRGKERCGTGKVKLDKYVYKSLASHSELANTHRNSVFCVQL